MNDQQENRLSRNEKVASFLKQRPDQLQATPAITATLVPQLIAVNEKMRDDDAHAVQDNTGYADSKENIEQQLETMADHVGSGLESYADDVDDFVLMNSVEFTLSQIQGFRDNRLLEYAQFVYAKATDTTIQPVLVSDHNIAMQDLAMLQSLIAAYETANPLPQQMKGESVAWGKQVDRDFADADKILVRIRRKMNTYRTTNLLLFDGFQAVDSIDDTGGHSGGASTIGAGQTKPVAQFTYEASSKFTLANLGGDKLTLAMYSNNVQTGKAVDVNGGDTYTATLGDLAAEGNELRLANNGTDTGTYTFSM